MHEELVSTNDHGRDLGAAGYPHGLVILAESQTAGRGRRENRWQAEAGRDVLMTVLLRPAAPLHQWPRITTLTALALCKAIEATTSLRPQIKWPNDVYVRDRKVAGILAETFTDRGGAYMVLGMGLNVNTQRFPKDLRDSATSLLMECGDERAALDRSAITIALLKQIAICLGRLENSFENAVQEVRDRSWLLGKLIEARVSGTTLKGTAVNLNEEGHLIVNGDDGITHVLTSADHVRLVV